MKLTLILLVCSVVLIGVSKSKLVAAQGILVSGNQVAMMYEEKVQHAIVEGAGTIIEILQNKPQQRFIVRLANSQIIHIVHDTELAAPITELREGDIIEFRGKYEWTEEGGRLTHTYFDNNEEQSGWLRYHGELFQ